MDVSQATIKTSLPGLAIACCFAATANATVIYNTPGTSVINTSVNDNVEVNNRATVLNIESGGVVQGTNATFALGAVHTRAGTLNVTGNGQIIAGAGQAAAISMRGVPAVVRLQDQSSVTGNIVMEFNTPGWQSEATALNRLYVEDQASVTGDVFYANFIRIQDQARIDGNIRNADNGSISLDMRGGVVTGQVQFGGLNDYVFNMTDGAILGGVRGAAGYMDMTMSGGYIANGFRTGDFVTGTITGGKIEGGISTWHGSTSGSSDLIVSGGRFDADAGDYLVSMTGFRYFPSSLSASSLEILGGQWGYEEAGLGFFFDHWVDFSVTGWDLAFVDGLLSGYLLDGSWFSNYFNFGTDWHGTFTINNVTAPSVPEPGTLGMLAISLAGVMFARRRVAKPE